MRIYIENYFKEVHVKIFNTGKVEIPGIQNDNMLRIIMNNIINILKKIVNNNIYFKEEATENILINSNFNCGFYINREKLYKILIIKYNINCIYDPCSYPGIRCIYNCNNSKISFMIFRTGSILIVGKCSDEELMISYNYIKTILLNEYSNIIYENCNINFTNKVSKTSVKNRKKYIFIEKKEE